MRQQSQAGVWSGILSSGFQLSATFILPEHRRELARFNYSLAVDSVAGVVSMLGFAPLDADRIGTPCRRAQPHCISCHCWYLIASISLACGWIGSVAAGAQV
jgi:hypothetical protein